MTQSPWFPFFYQYIIGGIVFFAALTIAIKKKSLVLSFKSDRAILFQLLAGFLFYLALHGAMIIFAGVSNA